MRTLIIAAALFLGTASHADTSADKKPGTKESAKSKTGGACKEDADCDQSRPQRCRDSKCELRPVHPVT